MSQHISCTQIQKFLGLECQYIYRVSYVCVSSNTLIQAMCCLLWQVLLAKFHAFSGYVYSTYMYHVYAIRRSINNKCSARKCKNVSQWWVRWVTRTIAIMYMYLYMHYNRLEKKRLLSLLSAHQDVKKAEMVSKCCQNFWTKHFYDIHITRFLKMP